jgi:hypothetical protein
VDIGCRRSDRNGRNLHFKHSERRRPSDHLDRHRQRRGCGNGHCGDYRQHGAGLIWEVKTDDGGVHDKGNFYTWQDAQDVFITQLNSENFGGQTDWRLPTIKELSTLVHADTWLPAINTAYFPQTLLSGSWSSTTYAFGTDVAWFVSFVFGGVNRIDKSCSFGVRAVRGGQ